MYAQLYSRVDQYLTMSLLHPYHVAFTCSFNSLFHVICFDNFVGIGDSDRSRDDVVGIETFEFLFIYSASINYKQLC